jgi:hypothetical protein
MFGLMEDIMQELYFQKKGADLNTVERFYIHKEASFDNQLNNKHNDDIFDNFNWVDTL